MAENAEELRAYFDEKKEKLEEVIEEAEEVLRYLNVAHDYLEEAIENDWDDDTWLPSSSIIATNAMTRLLLISDRIAYREEERDEAAAKIENIEEDFQWELEARGWVEEAV